MNHLKFALFPRQHDFKDRQQIYIQIDIKYQRWTMTEKTNELIINVREHLLENQKQIQETMKNIENQIDEKNLQIRNIFAENLTPVIEHFTNYHEIVGQQKKLQNLCEDFSKRIEKTQTLNQYDEQMIEKGEKTIDGLKQKRKQLQSYKNSITQLKKILINISQERYNNAIKIMNLYSADQPKSDTPLKKALPILLNKIYQHMTKLVSNFWDINSSRMIDIGTTCFNKIQMSTNEKINIYQAFFGRNSIANRNSLIRKSSVISSVVQDGNKGDAPLRFIKKVKDCQILQRYVLRINVEMNNLKQVKNMCKQLREEESFQSILNKESRKVIVKIMKQNPCENQMDLKRLLSFYIGFLLFRREVVAYFRFEAEENYTFAQVYECIGQQAKSILDQPENVSQVLKIKDNIDLFQKVLEIVHLEDNKSFYSKVLADIMRRYCKFSLEQYEALISEQMNQDTLVLYQTQDKTEQKILQTILYSYPKYDNSYEFTAFVVFVVQIFNQYYDRLIAFVKDSDLNKSQLHQHLSVLFERIITIYGGSLVFKDQTLQIAQGQTNLRYCQKAIKYFCSQLQNKHEYMRTCQLDYKQKLETVIVQLRRCMRQIVEGKIDVMLSSYELQSIWLSQNLNSQPHDFLQWMLQFIKQNINFMKESGSTTHQQMIYSWMGYICHLYWQYFEDCNKFSLVTIYNLELDLLYIYKYINNNFNSYGNLSEKFQPLGQFYSMMLNSNLGELLDRQKREIGFPKLDLHKIIPILKKYSKAKNNGNGKYRDLKNKQVQNIVKKLQNDYR